MSAQLLQLPRNETPEILAENFLDYARDGKVAWVLMAIMEHDGTARFEWSHLPNSFAAVGAAEMLKDALKDVC